MSTHTQIEKNGLFELTDEARAELVSSKYYNEDLAPTSVSQRTWTTYNITMLWVGMSICVPALSLATGLVSQGVSPWLAVLNVALGNIIILIPIQLNSQIGCKYGIPFPGFARLTFGSIGAHVPALLRAITACGWTAIQAGSAAARSPRLSAVSRQNLWTRTGRSISLPGAECRQLLRVPSSVISFLWYLSRGLPITEWSESSGYRTSAVRF